LGSVNLIFTLKTFSHGVAPNGKIVQIAMSLRDTTTDENELAMSYTVPRSECAEVGARLGATSLLQI
jgi:hypothetical protein